VPNITPVGAAVRVLGPKTENFNKYILPTFEIKMHCSSASLARLLQNFCRIWGLRAGSCVKIRGDSLKGFLSYGGFNMRGSSYSKFSVPLVANQMK